MIGREKLSALSNPLATLGEYMAGNWPHLWNNQVHIAVAGCAIGIAVTAIVEPFVYHTIALGLEPITPATLISITFLLQLGIVISWAVAAFRITRPTNIIEFKNSPLMSSLVLFGTMIMAGPIYLSYRYSNFLGEGLFVVPMLLSYMAIFAVGWRLKQVAKVYGNGNSSSNLNNAKSAVFTASTLIVAVLLAVLSEKGQMAPVFLFLALAFVVAALVIAFCFWTKRRFAGAGGFVFLFFACPVVGVLVFMSAAKANVSLPAVQAVLATFDPQRDPWLVIFTLWGLAVLWIDIVCWVAARFFLLPVKLR